MTSNDLPTKQAKTRILFVDDEEDVLAGLRTGLRRARKRFDCEFAVGGAKALELLDEHPFDVIVSDMRMPGMNGVELLTRVSEEHPDVVRIVLSGEAGSDLLIQALHITHQWLSKPCSSEAVIAALDNAVRYRSLLRSSDMLESVMGLDTLPSPPHLYERVIECATSPNASADDIAALVIADPAITAKVLQLANSAFASGSHVSDLQSAIVRIGIENLSRLVLVAGLLETWTPDVQIPGMSTEACLDLAHTAAAEAAKLAGPDIAAEATIASLLHPVGLILMATAVPERLEEVVQHAQDHSIDVVAAGRTLHGIDHALLAGNLLSVWGLPSDIVLAVVNSVESPVDAGDPTSLDDVVRVAVRSAQAQLAEQIDPALLFAPLSEDLAA